MQVKKQQWRSITVLVALIGFFISGQKAHSRESDFPYLQMDRVGQSSFKSDTSEDRAERETKWMKKKLKLTKEQLQSVKAINAVYAFKRENYMATKSPQSEENKQKIRDTIALLDKEKDYELRRVFTEKQYNLYLKKKPELVEKLRLYKIENELIFQPSSSDIFL